MSKTLEAETRKSHHFFFFKEKGEGRVAHIHLFTKKKKKKIFHGDSLLGYLESRIVTWHLFSLDPAF